MILQSFLIIDFSAGQREQHTIVVPIGSKLLKLKCFDEGIFGYYSVPEIALNMPDKQHETYTVINRNAVIPPDATFVDVLDVAVEAEDQKQIIVAFPVFKIDHKLKKA